MRMLAVAPVALAASPGAAAPPSPAACPRAHGSVHYTVAGKEHRVTLGNCTETRRRLWRVGLDASEEPTLVAARRHHRLRA